MSRYERNLTLEYFLDAWGFVKSLSAPTVEFLALIGIILTLLRFRSYGQQITDLTTTIQQLGRAALTKDGDPIFDVKVLIELRQQLETIRLEFVEHQKAATTHYADVEHLATQDKYINCDISRCVHLQNVFNRIDRVVERLDQFDRRADDSRASTTVSLQAIGVAQKELGRELGELAKTIITVLGDIIRDRDRR